MAAVWWVGMVHVSQQLQLGIACIRRGRGKLSLLGVQMGARNKCVSVFGFGESAR